MLAFVLILITNEWLILITVPPQRTQISVSDRLCVCVLCVNGDAEKNCFFFFVKNVIPFYYNIIARTFILFRQFILNLLDAATQSFLATRCTHTHTHPFKPFAAVCITV